MHLARSYATWMAAVCFIVGGAIGAPTATAAVTGKPGNASHDGGYSITTASEIRGSRTVTQDYVIGEYLYWKVRLPAGHSMDVRAVMDFGSDYPSFVTNNFQITVYNSLLEETSCGPDYTGSARENTLAGRITLTCETGVTDIDDEDYPPGTYYVAIAVAAPTDEAVGLTKQLEAEFTLRKDGEVIQPPPATAGGPSTGDETKSAKGGDSDRATNGDPGSGNEGFMNAGLALPAGVAMAGVVVGLLSGYAAARRFRRQPASVVTYGTGAYAPPPGFPPDSPSRPESPPPSEAQEDIEEPEDLEDSEDIEEPEDPEASEPAPYDPEPPTGPVAPPRPPRQDDHGGEEQSDTWRLRAGDYPRRQ